MKTSTILEWIISQNINGKFLHTIDVPEEGEEEWQQNEEWWCEALGFYPPAPIEAGRYLYFYVSEVEEDVWDAYNGYCEPDAEIEVCNSDHLYGYDYIHLYKLEG